MCSSQINLEQYQIFLVLPWITGFERWKEARMTQKVVLNSAQSLVSLVAASEISLATFSWERLLSSHCLASFPWLVANSGQPISCQNLQKWHVECFSYKILKIRFSQRGARAQENAIYLNHIQCCPILPVAVWNPKCCQSLASHPRWEVLKPEYSRISSASESKGSNQKLEVGWSSIEEAEEVGDCNHDMEIQLHIPRW